MNSVNVPNNQTTLTQALIHQCADDTSSVSQLITADCYIVPGNQKCMRMEL